MVTLHNVSKTYGEETAVAPLSLTVAPEQTTVLIGPSGSGKSTLLRLMIGLIRPDSGNVRFADEELSRENLRRIRHRMGYVIQEGGLFPHLTARANVTLLARHLGWSEERIAARVEELTSLVHLASDRLGQLPDDLSGGQRQRVSLMRALMLDPAVLLLDEPLGALDPMIRASLQNDLRSIFGRLNKTVVIVTHDMHEAAYFGDQIILLREGAIVQQGSLEELLKQPNESFVSEFIYAQNRSLPSLDSPNA